MVASAVVVPEAVEQTLSHTPTGATKRRQSSVSQGDSKRVRPSDQDPPQSVITANAQTLGSPLEQTSINTSRRAKTDGRDTERQRGKRLFGALLGTLSQSSSSTAQKRRAEIEKKQRDKLREQAEEDNEQKRKALEELMTVRRTEQKRYDEQSMRIRHSNSLVMARFLQTATEPGLYYKPWELLPRQKERLLTQIREAEAKIDAELEIFDEENPQQHVQQKEKSPEQANIMQLDGTKDVEILPETTTVGSSEPLPEVSTNLNETDPNANTNDTSENIEAEQAKETGEDNEDGMVVEAGEDPVIY